MNQTRTAFDLVRVPLHALLLGALFIGCSGSDDDDTNTFDVIRTDFASASASTPVVEGKWMVYLASEALSAPGGTNFNVANGDADLGDDCAVVVDMTTKSETNLNVATTAIKILGDQIYLIVSEAADSKDWNVDADTADTVLLHYSYLSPLAFVDELAAATHVWGIAGGRLYFASGDITGLVNGDTTLSYLTTAAPTTPVSVLHTDALSILQPRILAVDENLIFLTADENLQAADLNGDLDMTDPFVLALLNGSDIAGVIQNVGLSVKDNATPVRARSIAANDWLVGFLVEEATQSDALTGLNDPVALGFGNSWKPSNCAGYADIDTLDQVLHALEFAAWSADPIADAPENTGIPGTDRVLCSTTAVATLVLEADDGLCDLNADGDTLDKVLRWAIFTSPQLPFGLATQLNAVESTTPGGTFGISDMSNKWLCVVSESQDNTDHDADTLKTHNLVAWLNPAAVTPAWTFDHGDGAGLQPAGASWLADRPQRDRLMVGFQEAVLNVAINTGDSDKLDSVPSWALFDPGNPSDFDFPGPAVAVASPGDTVPGVPGTILANSYALYRVSEAADNRDWTSDGQKDDFVMFRTDINTNFSAYIGLTNNLAGPVAFNSGTLGAAYLADEAMAGADLNGDGRLDGFIVSWFRIN